MANKRIPLTERVEKDSAKGVDLFFNKPKPESEVTTADAVEAPEAQKPVIPTEVEQTSPIKVETPVPSPTPPPATKKATVAKEPVTKGPSRNPKEQLAKATVYIRPDQVVSIEAIQLQQRQKTGIKPDKSDLMIESLDLLIEKYLK